MKKLFLMNIVLLFAFVSCAKPAKVAENPEKSQNQQQSEKTESAKEEKIVNSEFVKLNNVLSSMSERCKEAIPNGNPQEFLDDLHKVLDSESEFSSTDLSPFYLIDKKHNVSSDYEPQNLIHLEKNELFEINKNSLSLRPEAFEALKILAAVAKKDGITLTVSSTYRSYEYQKNLFDYWVSVDGLYEAERESARPGTSQHQLGMAMDFAPVDDAFDKTPAGAWVYKNAANYGWSLSFPQNYEDVTGYRWECWHFRYIGVEACKFQKKWFGDVQQFMIEFIDAWKNYENQPEF